MSTSNIECSFCRSKGHARTETKGTKIIMICPELCQTCWGSYHKCSNKLPLGKGKNGCGTFNPNTTFLSQREISKQQSSQQRSYERKPKLEPVKAPVQKSINRFNLLDDDNDVKDKDIKEERFPALSKQTSVKDKTFTTISYAKVAATPKPEKVEVVQTKTQNKISFSNQEKDINLHHNIIQSLLDKISNYWSPDQGYGYSGFNDSEAEFLDFVRYTLEKYYPVEAYLEFTDDDMSFCSELNEQMWPKYIAQISSS